jgi:hypothetical protein
MTGRDERPTVYHSFNLVVNLLLRVRVSLVVYLLAKGAQLCERGYQINLSHAEARVRIKNADAYSAFTDRANGCTVTS